MKNNDLTRRRFMALTGTALAGSMLSKPASALWPGFVPPVKKRLAMVGTGIRGTSFWGLRLMQQYSDLLTFVGICDINPGRVAYARDYMNAACPTFTNFDEMMDQTMPDLVIVTTVDSTHDEFIVKSLEKGADVLTEKPLTTDEVKCQKILDAERKTGRKVMVGFNYRYQPHATKLKEMLVSNTIGRIVSVDFNWYLNVHHGASYFRRWHGLRHCSGTLLVHKATHHFDLLNWWLDSDPVEVMAYGALEHYGRNHPFRGDHCRTCSHKERCKFHWDITTDKRLMDLYVKNEHYDGYIRDNCVFRNEIDIYDKMSVQIKYANDAMVNYSLTTYSPYEGWRIAFNGFDGRIDSWQDIPWRRMERISQAELHAREMSQSEITDAANYKEIMVMKNFGEYEHIKVRQPGAGHGGGDARMQDMIFRDRGADDLLRHRAGTRDGAFSILIGIAARKSIESGRPVRIADLTDLAPQPVRPT
jgi:predicted dehydrogenase